MALGRVVGAHGLRGELRVRTTLDDASVLARVSHVRLAREAPADTAPAGRAAGGEAPEGPEGREHEVLQVRPGRAGELRVTLAGVDDRDAALALRGIALIAAADELAPLAEGEFYQYELIGCRLEDGEGREVGVVRGVWETGAPDVLVVEDAAGREQLVPMAEPLVRFVSLAERRIRIDLPPGLLEPAADGDESEESE